MPRAIFTAHAKEQLYRTSLSVEEVLAIANDPSKYVLVGKDGNSERAHKLFYCERVGKYFVIVQDDATGQIITFLPPHYHQRFCISADALTQARVLVEGELPERPIPLEPSMPQVRLTGTVVRHSDGRSVSVGLMKIDHSQYVGNPSQFYPEELTSNEDFCREVWSKLADGLVRGGSPCAPSMLTASFRLRVSSKKVIDLKIPCPKDLL